MSGYDIPPALMELAKRFGYRPTRVMYSATAVPHAHQARPASEDKEKEEVPSGRVGAARDTERNG